MKNTVKNLYIQHSSLEGEIIEVCGWVKTARDSKAIGFLGINDGSYFKPVQIVIEADKLSNYTEIVKLPISSSVRVTGTIVLTPNAGQPFEINALSAEILGVADLSYPLQNKKHSFEYLRTISHLRPRANTFNAVFRVRSRLAHAIHSFFQERDFVYVNTPIITGSDCEGAGEMFCVTTLDLLNIPLTSDKKVDFSKDFFAKPTNLTVSGQLEGEAFCTAFGSIYTFGPTFRAENSNTSRHAAEFWMVEPEIAFADLQDDMALAEDMIKYIINDVIENCPCEMDFFNRFIDKGLLDRLNNILSSDFVRITYTEAIDLLNSSGHSFEYPVKWGCDLQTEHERYLTEYIFQKPVFVKDYPKEIKAFYMRANDDGKTVAAVDLLVPGVGEIIGGSQREERFELLDAKIRDMTGYYGTPSDSADAEASYNEYLWYLDLRKFGTVKHAGFGLGFERMLMYITGMSNIRDVIPFPRTH